MPKFRHFFVLNKPELLIKNRLILTLVCFILQCMIYGLISLGHIKHDAGAQRAAIVAWAKRQNLTINAFILFEKNPDISTLAPGDTVICHDWDCLCGERAFLREFLQRILTDGLCLYSTRSEYCLDQGRHSMKYAFEMYAEIWDTFISYKNFQGARRRAANGGFMGRPRGARGTRHKMEAYQGIALRMHRDGRSMYAIAHELGVSAPTIKRFLSAQGF